MPIVQQIRDQLPEAVRAGDTRQRDILRLLIAAFDNVRIAARHEMSDDEAITTLQREAKQRRDSIEQYRAGGRDDLVRHEQDELDFIVALLPAELSPEELTAMVSAVIAEVGAAGPKDMGKVMGSLVKRVAGRTDGAQVSALVREQLANLT